MAQILPRPSDALLNQPRGLYTYLTRLVEKLESAYKEAARISSYPSPSTGLLSATDAGGDATVTIAEHTRVYPVQSGFDIPDLPVQAGTVTGLDFATEYFIFYDDPTLEDDTPTFQATTSAAVAQIGAATGRHYVGAITTPADGGADTDGNGGDTPSGRPADG